MGCLYRSPYLKTGISPEEEMKRLQESERVDDSKVTASFRHNSTDTHTNLEKLCLPIQNLLRFKPERIPARRRQSQHNVPPLSRKLCAINTCEERENRFLQGVSHHPYSTMGRLSSSWPSKTKATYFLLTFLSH